MEGTFWEKTGVFLIILGMIIAGMGAAAWLFASPVFVWVFYAGFLLAIIGFAIAVFTKL